MVARAARAHFLILTLGCASVHYVPGERVVGFAIGEDSKAEVCIPRGESGIISSAPQECIRVEGGPIIPSLLDGLGNIVTSAAKLLWSWIL